VCLCACVSMCEREIEGSSKAGVEDLAHRGVLRLWFGVQGLGIRVLGPHNHPTLPTPTKTHLIRQEREEFRGAARAAAALAQGCGEDEGG